MIKILLSLQDELRDFNTNNKVFCIACGTRTIYYTRFARHVAVGDSRTHCCGKIRVLQ